MKDQNSGFMSGLAVLLLGGQGHQQSLWWEVSYNVHISLCWSPDDRVL